MRGYQKKVIFLKNTGSHLFDEAYFVMSREGEEAAIDQSDMVFEANRIINESLGGRESRIGRERGGKKRKWKGREQGSSSLYNPGSPSWGRVTAALCLDA